MQKNYSPFQFQTHMITGEKWFTNNPYSGEPTFPMHCQRRSRWFFSKYSCDWECRYEVEHLAVKVRNVKSYEL